MLKDKLVFCITCRSGFQLKPITISKQLFVFCNIILIIGIIFFGCLVKDNIYLKKELLKKHESSENKILPHSGEITWQREIVKNILSQINFISLSLADLNSFERQVRKCLNIDESKKQYIYSGIGGPIPVNPYDDFNSQKKFALRVKLFAEMQNQIEVLTLSAKKQKSCFKTLITHIKEQQNYVAATPSIYPVKGVVTSDFGYRKSPFTGKREFHKGLDIAAPRGTAVLSTADGIVTYAYRKGSFGKIVIIDHGYGVMTCYAHLWKILKKCGDVVKKGDIIAKVGSTGRSTGPHLHYEIRLYGVKVNPKKYLLNNVLSDFVLAGNSQGKVCNIKISDIKFPVEIFLGLPVIIRKNS